MMGWVAVGAAGGVACYFYRESDPLLMWLAIVVGGVSLWTFGVMHNYAVSAASRREGYRDKIFDFTESEIAQVPDGLALINMAAAFATFVLIIIAVVRRF